MKKNYILTLILTLLISGFSFGQGLEDFANSEANSSYSDNNFVGNSGITWSYIASRDANNDSNSSGISLPALMLRRVSSGSKITSSTISGGIGNFSVKLYKGFTGAGNRQVELFVNGVSQGTSTPFDNNEEQVFSVPNINITGDIIIEIVNITSKQVIIYDITWTAPVVYDLLDDFETALPAGALVGDSGMATTPEVVADPATGGTNGDVLKIVTSAAGNGWQNAQLFLQGDLLDLTTDDKVVTVDVYSESAFMMLAKTATPSNGGAESATDASHTGSGWETLTFDFSDPKDNTPVANDIFGRILFFPQWNGAGWNDSSVTTTYVDNIKGIGYESTPPTGDNSVTIATTQAWNSYVNVFSVSDNSYQFGFGDIEVADLRATATETSVTLEPNISIWTNESTNAAYFDQDAATQTPVAYIEASTYIENASLANNALTFSGNISTSDLGDGYTVIALIKSLTSSYSQVAFKSVDISSTGDFTVTATAEEMSQAVIQYGFAVTGPLADPSDTTLGSVVIGAETLGIEDTDIVNVSVYPNPSNSNWNFRTPNTVITSVEVFNLLGKRVVLRKNNSTDIAISTQGLTSGIYIARITTEQGTKSVKLIKE